jgi:SpoVK/Ycf46/Vps4 family AAA+-type ATPase
MKQDFRFIDEVFRIVNGALRLDIGKVRNYTAFLADKLEQAGEVAAAKRLRKLLEETDHTLQPLGVTSTQTVPVDPESRFALVERVNPRLTEDPPLVLAEDKWELLKEFLSVAKSHAQMEAHGIATTLTFLLYGPPGCGKSRVARYIGAELGLDLYVVRLDGVISSFLGSTSKNIRGVFEFAARTPGVLFLDEFDAIAKLRGDEQEHGELKRVVNSFIQNLDGIGSQSVVIAATNHEELLDRAIWRRFSYRLEVPFPSFEERTALWQGSLGVVGFSRREVVLLADLSDGFSGSDIHEVCLRLQRKQVTRKGAATLVDAVGMLRSFASGEGTERKFLSGVSSASAQELGHALRARNAKLYSHAALAALLGVSKATAYRWTKVGEESHGRQ